MTNSEKAAFVAGMRYIIVALKQLAERGMRMNPMEAVDAIASHFPEIEEQEIDKHIEAFDESLGERSDTFLNGAEE